MPSSTYVAISNIEQTMMKDEFEMHHGALDLIQPNDVPVPWVDCTPIGFHFRPGDSTNYSGAPGYLSEFMDHVTSQISNGDDSTDEFSVDNNDNFPTGIEHRPRKAPRRDYGSSVSGGGATTTKSLDKTTEEEEEKGLSTMTLLLECAVAISVENMGEASRMVLELTQLASPYSDSCAERVAAYFAKAMASRVVSARLGICSPLVPHKSVLAAFQAFNNVSPFIKFSHFTANQAILEAFHSRDRVHIVDLDIMQGLQWPALFHILATRADGPPHVRMTGLGASMEALQETGRQLSNFARRLGMPFEFQPIARRFGDLDPSTAAIQTRRGEAVAVHWLQHSLYDATGPDWNTMRLLAAMNPTVITLVEQEMVRAGSFLDRFVGSLHYYSTLFDSLGATLAADDANRQRVEDGLLAREVGNILAVGWPARSEEEKFGSWRVELARCRPGFSQVPMSSNAMAQAQLILNMFPPSLGYNILQGDGTLRLGWKDTGLYTVSAWTTTSQQQQQQQLLR